MTDPMIVLRTIAMAGPGCPFFVACPDRPKA